MEERARRDRYHDVATWYRIAVEKEARLLPGHQGDMGLLLSEGLAELDEILAVQAQESIGTTLHLRNQTYWTNINWAIGSPLVCDWSYNKLTHKVVHHVAT